MNLTAYLCIACFVRFTVVGTVEVQDVLQNVLDSVNKLEDRVEYLEEKNALLEEKIASFETKEKNQRRFVVQSSLPVAFTARISPYTVDHVNPGDVIPFTDVLTNQGGGFNANTSTFVAPIAGTYIITCSLLDHLARSDGTGVMLHANVKKNGMVLARVFAHAEGTSYRDQGSNTVFVELQVGDRVWVNAFDSKDVTVGGQLYSTFSGYLLWPME